VAILGLYFEIVALAKRVDHLAQFHGCPLPETHQQERNSLRLMMLRHLVAGTPLEPAFAVILGRSEPS
jgi:hypothetical protein